MVEQVIPSDEARRWIEENLDAGCASQDIARSLQKSGIDTDFAVAAVAAVAKARAARKTFVEGPTLHAPGVAVPVLARIASPRIAVLERVLEDEECEALIHMARPRLTPSTVIDPESGNDVVATYRGSEGMFFRPLENALITILDHRLSGLLNLPVENGEGLQVLRYPVGAESAPHFDFLLPTNDANRASVARSGQRLATLIVYLNTVDAGGETVFPELGLAVQPHRGYGLCFEYRDPLGNFDSRALHAGAAVQQGEKWIVTKWMRSKRFVPRGAAG